MEPSALTESPDVQNRKPTINVSLSRVGVTGVEKVIRIGPAGQEQPYHAKLECFVDLFERAGHLRDSQEPLLLTLGNQCLQLFSLPDRCLVGEKTSCLDRCCHATTAPWIFSLPARPSQTAPPTL